MKKVTWAAIALTMASTASSFSFAGDLNGPDGNAELVGKVYDLGHLRMLESESESNGLILFPTSRVNRPIQTDSWQSLTDPFLSLVGTVLWEEIEYDGRTMDSSGENHLYLKAPESTHGDLKALLGFYEGLCTAETQVQFYWARVPQDAVAPSGIVPISHAMDWVSSLPKGSVSMDRVGVPANRAATIRQVRSTPILSEADVEIAQGVSAVDDVTRHVGSGRWAMVHAVPGSGGLQLSLTWTDVAHPNLTWAELALSALLGAEGKPASPQRLGGKVQLMHQPANVSSSRVFVPEGMASVTRVNCKDGQSTLLVAIPGQAAPVEQSFNLTGNRKDRGVAFLMRSLVPLQVSWNLDEGFIRAGNWDDEWCWRNQSDSSEWMAHRALEDTAQDLVEMNQVGGYIVLHTAHGVSRDQLPVAHMELDRAAKRLRDLIVRQPSHKVTLSVFQGEGNQVLQLEQVMAEGSKSSWFCGAERSFIRDFDVEVAQYSSIHDPSIKLQMEGSMIELSLARDAKGDLTVTMDAVMNLPQSEAPLDFDSPLFNGYRRMTYQQARFRGMKTLGQTGQPGAYRAYYGGDGEDAIHMKLHVGPAQ